MNVREAELLVVSRATRSPRIHRNEQGEVLGINVDRIVCYSDFVIMSGWVIGQAALNFFDHDDRPKPPGGVIYFERADVTSGYNLRNTRASGFLAAWPLHPANGLRLRLAEDPAGADFCLDVALPSELLLAELMQLVAENAVRAGFLLGQLAHSQIAVAAIVNCLLAPPEAFIARGHLEHARGIAGAGGLIVGWAAAEPSASFLLISDDGHVKPLTSATRWNRPDVTESVGHDLGSYTFDAGFLLGWEKPVDIDQSIHLVSVSGYQAFEISRIKWIPAPIDPVSFARWSFDFPTPPNKFALRLSQHDGPVIEALIKRKNDNRPTGAAEVATYGAPNEEPLVSVVIPLYGRHDFLLNQLLEFALDETLRRRAEIIYVVDDPRLVTPMAVDAPIFHKSYQVPFSVVWSGANRGFAGATNFGVSRATAPLVLLLNSDVIPVEPGWLDDMMAALGKNPKFGIMGARLLYPNGAIQHDGMDFNWEPSWDAYLNKHPGSGMEAVPTTSKEPATPPCVTAACLLMRRDLYNEVGGLDETFLIGDFEDSDLCLKVRKAGFEIGCLRSTALVHLERQSFSGIGSDLYRDKVARYNAWIHQRRWGHFIDDLMTQKPRKREKKK